MQNQGLVKCGVCVAVTKLVGEFRNWSLGAVLQGMDATLCPKMTGH